MNLVESSCSSRWKIAAVRVALTAVSLRLKRATWNAKLPLPSHACFLFAWSFIHFFAEMFFNVNRYNRASKVSRVSIRILMAVCITRANLILQENLRHIRCKWKRKRHVIFFLCIASILTHWFVHKWPLRYSTLTFSHQAITKRVLSLYIDLVNGLGTETPERCTHPRCLRLIRRDNENTEIAVTVIIVYFYIILHTSFF